MHMPVHTKMALPSCWSSRRVSISRVHSNICCCSQPLASVLSPSCHRAISCSLRPSQLSGLPYLPRAVGASPSGEILHCHPRILRHDVQSCAVACLPMHAVLSCRRACLVRALHHHGHQHPAVLIGWGMPSHPRTRGAPHRCPQVCDGVPQPAAHPDASGSAAALHRVAGQ